NNGGSDVSLSSTASGVHVGEGAGKFSMLDWLNSRKANASQPLGTIPAGQARAFKIADLKPNYEAVSAIYDLSVTGPVQVGTVILNTPNTAKFEQARLTYAFEGVAGDTSRTFLSDGMLQGDPSGKHTRGTFAHNQRDVTLPTYDLDAGQRYGWVLGGKPSQALSPEYEMPLDT